MSTTTAATIPALPLIIDVATDYEGLGLALQELLTQAFDQPDRQRLSKLADTAANAAEIRSSAASATFSLSPAYYDRVGYLLGLEQMTSIGVRFSLDDLTMSEVRGLQLLKTERAKFNLDHPACPRCGVQNRKFAFRCRGCQAQFQVATTGKGR